MSNANNALLAAVATLAAAVAARDIAALEAVYKVALAAFVEIAGDSGWTLEQTDTLVAEECPRAAVVSWVVYKRLARPAGKELRINRTTRKALWIMTHAKRAIDANR